MPPSCFIVALARRLLQSEADYSHFQHQDWFHLSPKQFSKVFFPPFHFHVRFKAKPSKQAWLLKPSSAWECIWSRKSEFIHPDEAGWFHVVKNDARCSLEWWSPAWVGESHLCAEQRALQWWQIEQGKVQRDESDWIKSWLRTGKRGRSIGQRGWRIWGGWAESNSTPVSSSVAECGLLINK